MFKLIWRFYNDVETVLTFNTKEELTEKMLELASGYPASLNYLRWNECQSAETIREKANLQIDCLERLNEINKRKQELNDQSDKITKEYYKFKREAEDLGIHEEVAQIVDDEYYSHLEDDD